MIDLLEVKRRYEAVLAVEDSRDKILQNLFAQVESLQRALQNTLGDAKFQELKKYKTEYDDLRLDQSKLSFVSVLVDGDCMNFNDTLIRQGYNGGRKAAMLLRKSVERHIRDIDPQASPNIQYRIRVYANVPGLMKTYREAHILRSNEALDPFIRGFNMENSLCDFIDAGNGKECSDVKIRATFEQDILDVHCRRIVFCGSTDNGYARILGSHQGSNRISLVQGAPFAWEMEQLASEFQTTSFPEVFRSTKLPSRASSFSAFKTASANSSPSSSPTSLSTPSTPKRNYATIAKSNLQATSPTRTNRSKRSKISVITFDISPSYDTHIQFNTVQLNSQSQRVDPPPRASSRENFERLRRSKYCSRYHILGECPLGDECGHRHGRRLGSRDVHDLWCVTRTCVCPNDIWCTDPKCICGHQCPWENQQGHCSADCKFPESMHGVDKSVAVIL
ncbi:hypothetical protein AtubIFM56815_007915 [Aspergillus tubingensis]|uniref:C3H1-type domain-containing protein n=1 Tax=Aspergillus tubingensis TaxID=5068 RepID=A0A9W6AJW9_ASPTU|nr:hypothetical protein AtubIFM54640_009858 [Aspergillus tubingensis]GLA83710.1 hypothetical protein AtubIFM56815_007915 [Aspergillus tubingensis]GLA90722.1 hypothetical protein AtubIFM57143_000329 [Aspergillus tubingensis]GLB14349.1 hypothetical protein AtubIFM61612_001774 [Aspergillus tubingensis]